MQENRPKVLALYQAVLDLVDQGADINAVTVSDITRKAGIGKGTAYEYFKSKEEILACAFIYDVEEKVEQEKKRIDESQTFAQKMRYAFDWIEQGFKKRKSFARVLRMCVQPGEISGALLEELQKRGNPACGPRRILYDICLEAKEKGEIREDIPISAACTVSLANMAAYAMFLEKREQAPDVEPAWMKEFLCNGLLAQLSPQDGK